MDELMEMFSSFIGEALQSERNMEEEFKELERKVNQCVKQATERGTPVQNKKRPKRHASISEKDESEIKDDDSTVLDHERTASSRGSANRMLDVAPSDEPMVAEEVMPEATVASMPPPPAPVVAAVEKAARPSRTARLKAQEKLKEPSLVEKMRNPNASIKVKVERSSTVANSNSGGSSSNDKSLVDKNLHKTTTPTTSYDEMEVENDANRMNRMDNVVPPIDETATNKEGNPKNASDDHRDSAGEERLGKASLMVIQPMVPKVEIVSDEEMPPPKMPAPKPAAPRTGRGRGRPPKVSKSKSTIQPDSDTMEPVRIKTEKLSIVESAESTFTITTDPPLRSLNVVLEKMAIPKGTPPPASTTVTTSPGMEMPDPNGTYLLETACPKGTPPSATTTTSPGMGLPNANGTYLVDTTFSKGTPPASTADPNGTFAITTSSSGNNRGLPSVQDGTFVIEKNDSSSEPNAAERKNLVNASIMTEDDSVVENSPQQQPPPALPVVLPTVKPSFSKATTEGKSKKASTTGTLKKSSSSNALGSARSNATAALADNGKKHKELFNPCVQSPIKSRIEAFEKCAFGSTTATKAASGTPLVGRIMKTASTPTLTPHATALDAAGYGLAGVRSANAARPMAGSTVTTPNITMQPITKASSASKISQMRSKMLHQHNAHSGAAHAGSGARGPLSLSREPSWDRAAAGTPSTSGTLSAASSTSSLLDEKKKKREEKQRIAAEQREAKEREKREHMERLRREKEEKYQKLLQEKQEKIRLDAVKKARKLEEFEKRRQQEEQRALADQKRDELAKQLEQQRIDRELLEALKQNQMMKENTEIKLQKQMHQQKLRQQQQQAAAAAAAAKKKAAAGGRRVQQFTFDMIETDDSTDEDEPADASKKNKRPPLPEWCKNVEEYRKALLIQSRVDTKVIDRLFSVQPTTPDLRELFPSIDAHKLKRNSSAIWRTPPRGSQIP